MKQTIEERKEKKRLYDLKYRAKRTKEERKLKGKKDREYLKKKKQLMSDQEKEIHRLKKREYDKKDYKKHKQKRFLSSKKWRENNEEKMKEYRLKYQENHKEEILKRAKEYQSTPEFKLKYREYIKKYRTNPTNRLAHRLGTHLRNILKLTGIRKRERTFELVGCSKEKLQQHIESKFKNGMCWKRFPEIHIDHIRPCSSFNLTNLEERKVCFHYTNLQPLWAKDNLKKSDKIGPEWNNDGNQSTGRLE